MGRQQSFKWYIESVKAITLWQPWATLVALGLKMYETRSWHTNHRGLLAIHAAGRGLFRPGYMDAANTAIVAPGLKIEDLPFGSIVAVVDLSRCVRISQMMIHEIKEGERLVGDWTPGRYAWKLDNVRQLSEPVVCNGARKLWNVPTSLIELLHQGGVTCSTRY